MPAKDHYHDAVKRALIKDGWTIDNEQVLFIIADRHVWIDIQASKATETATILIEVKGFEGPSQVEQLVEAVGKYTVYRAVVDDAGGKNIPLYLAIPEKAYRGVLEERIGIVVRQQVQLKLLVFNLDSEEITTWIT
jgi:hypothetical protein